MTAAPQRSPWLLVRAALAVLVAAAMLTGCFEQESDTCEYWTPKLDSAPFTDRALDKVQEIGCKDALPALQRLFDDGQYRERILRAVKQIGDRTGGTPILRSGLKARDTAKLASSIVGDWSLAAARPELESILTGDSLPKFRAEALKAMLSFNKPAEIEDILIALAQADPNRQGIEVNQMAVEKLGEIPTTKGVEALVKAVFLRDNAGRQVYGMTRRALAQAGPAVVAPMKLVVAGKHEAINAYGQAAGLQPWQISDGPEGIQVLTDSLDKSVGPAIIASMKKNLAPPLGVSDAMKEKWRVAQLNRLKLCMLGLGAVGPTDIVPDLAAIVKDPMADAVNQRLHAASSLAFIGGKAAVDAMMAIFTEETDENFKEPFLQPLALGMDAEHLEAFDKIVAGKKVSGQVKRGLTDSKVQAYLGVVRACKNDGQCYITKLMSKDKNDVVKAAVMLARGIGDDAAVRRALIERFVEAERTELDVRRFAMIALARRGVPADGEELLKIARNMGRADAYWANELPVLGHWLKHKK